MRETIRAYAELMGLGFRSAPWHATCQLLTGVGFAISVPVGALGAQLFVNAAITGDPRGGLLAGALLAVTVGGALTCPAQIGRASCRERV